MDRVIKQMVHYDFDNLVKTYGKKVYNLAYRLTGNAHDAEDVTQETFLRVYKGLKTFRGESAIYTWIYRIGVNTSLRIKRKLDSAYIDSLDEKIELFKNDIPDEVKRWESNPEERYLYDELLRAIRQECYHFMIFRLSDEQRVVYVLRVVLGFSLDDITAILEIDKNTVKARLQRAKSNLGSYFSGRCQWFEGESSCNCQSRIGFALSYAPDILNRLKNFPYDNRIKHIVRSSLEKFRNIDDIYKNLPLESYQSALLVSYIKD
jgi:RNA polymerase sigma-70 factor (ECF subfamily)